MAKRKTTIDKTNFLLNYKGKKYKSNTLIGVIWKFLTKSE